MKPLTSYHQDKCWGCWVHVTRTFSSLLSSNTSFIFTDVKWFYCQTEEPSHLLAQLHITAEEYPSRDPTICPLRFHSCVGLHCLCECVCVLLLRCSVLTLSNSIKGLNEGFDSSSGLWVGISAGIRGRGRDHGDAAPVTAVVRFGHSHLITLGPNRHNEHGCFVGPTYNTYRVYSPHFVTCLAGFPDKVMSSKSKVWA